MNQDKVKKGNSNWESSSDREVSQWKYHALLKRRFSIVGGRIITVTNGDECSPGLEGKVTITEIILNEGGTEDCC